ncbi:uncharacterized protein [Dermacentor andersoni]|uniref:uncharacterized protein n=1 Tax=Dermacentor andersoni TaxID=34620 RepID=UPI002155B133|nr:nematocyst expressed protein 3-like [Dermacentor andersoni]
MKVLLLCLFLFLREASCGVVEAPAYGTALVPETGTSSQYRSQDVHGNYEFGYEEKHTSGGSFRQETGDAYGNKYGSYGLTDADGRVRIVKYVADANGFRVIVNTNEPGTAPSTPAAASINVPQEPVVPTPIVKAVVPAASVVTAAAAPAVVAAPAPAVVAAPAPAFVGAPGPAVVTAAVAPATVTSIRRFVPASIYTGATVAAPVVHTAPALPAVPVFGYRRAVAAAPVLTAAAPAVSYSTGFVPSLPYAASAIPPPPVRRVIVRKVVPAGYGAGYGVLRSSAATYAAPTVVAAPAVFGAKLSAAAPAYTYGGPAPVTSFAGKPLDYYEHLANKFGATYLRRRR